MKLNSIKDSSFQGKTVVVRFDYNVPLDNKTVQDDTRIKASLPTLKYLVNQGAKIIITSHLGRPKGKIQEDMRLTPVAKHLSQLIDKPVVKVDSCIGQDVDRAIEALGFGDVLMLENTRFHKEEKENDKVFAKKLASYGDIFVNDAFGTAHRAHASTEGIAHHLPAYAGLLMEKEIKALSPLLDEVERPFVLLLGGAKIDTKIGVIKAYIKKADTILLGGGLANTFVYARGYDVGESLCEKDKMELAQELIMEAEKEGCEIVTPGGMIVADEIADDVVTADMEITGVEGDMKMLDIGERSTNKYIRILKEAQTIIWNGPVGLYEKEPFENGTKRIAKALTTVKGKTYLGGGDTLDALKKFSIDHESFTHVSTGGGAMLEFLEGK
ncbi:phosphoglycerate kinase, partial [Candidatus Peregrinibacteria bacterium]|nr:phosphoglycerate kinase [Candidatus Peregrinibacteria bacterium]